MKVSGLTFRTGAKSPRSNACVHALELLLVDSSISSMFLTDWLILKKLTICSKTNSNGIRTTCSFYMYIFLIIGSSIILLIFYILYFLLF